MEGEPVNFHLFKGGRPDGAKGFVHLSTARMSCCGSRVGIYGRVGRWPFLISPGARAEKKRLRWMEDQTVERMRRMREYEEESSHVSTSH
jgi:hypothetical protein